MTLPHLRRLEKLEQKRAEQTRGIVTRIVCIRKGDNLRSGRVVWRDPEPEKPELQLDLDFNGADGFESEFPP